MQKKNKSKKVLEFGGLNTKIIRSYLKKWQWDFLLSTCKDADTDLNGTVAWILNEWITQKAFEKRILSEPDLFNKIIKGEKIKGLKITPLFGEDRDEGK